MKGIRHVLAISWTLIALGAIAVFGLSGNKEVNISDTVEKTVEKCEIPALAKTIGHEDFWLKHNACLPREEVQEKGEK